MKDTMPTLYSKDRYDEWIDKLIETCKTEFPEEHDPATAGHDDVRRWVRPAIMHSYSRSSWMNNYHDILAYSDAIPPKETITLPEDNPIDAMRQTARYCIIEDMAGALRRYLNDETAFDI